MHCSNCRRCFSATCLLFSNLITASQQCDLLLFSNHVTQKRIMCVQCHMFDGRLHKALPCQKFAWRICLAMLFKEKHSWRVINSICSASKSSEGLSFPRVSEACLSSSPATSPSQCVCRVNMVNKVNCLLQRKLLLHRRPCLINHIRSHTKQNAFVRLFAGSLPEVTSTISQLPFAIEFVQPGGSGNLKNTDFLSHVFK